MGGSQITLGAAMRHLRERNGWTLKEMSRLSGIPFSTLTKVEHDRLSMTYDKLVEVCGKLNVTMAELINAPSPPTPVMTGRRSLGRGDNVVAVETHNYDYIYLCADLRRKNMIPVFSRIKAASLEEFGPLVRHPGEEFTYVLRGSVVVYTDIYDPVILMAGESIYIDSNMEHGYVLAPGCDEAETLGVMFGHNDVAALRPEAIRGMDQSNQPVRWRDQSETGEAVGEQIALQSKPRRLKRV